MVLAPWTPNSYWSTVRLSLADVAVSVLMTDGTGTLDTEQLREYSPSLIGTSDGL
jgi:hypothetical protein